MKLSERLLLTYTNRTGQYDYGNNLAKLIRFAKLFLVALQAWR